MTNLFHNLCYNIKITTQFLYLKIIIRNLYIVIFELYSSINLVFNLLIFLALYTYLWPLLYLWLHFCRILWKHILTEFENTGEFLVHIYCVFAIRIRSFSRSCKISVIIISSYYIASLFIIFERYVLASCTRVNQHRYLPHNSIAIVPHSTTQDLLYYILQMTIVP